MNCSTCQSEMTQGWHHFTQWCPNECDKKVKASLPASEKTEYITIYRGVFVKANLQEDMWYPTGRIHAQGRGLTPWRIPKDSIVDSQSRVTGAYVKVRKGTIAEKVEEK